MDIVRRPTARPLVLAALTGVSLAFLLFLAGCSSASAPSSSAEELSGESSLASAEVSDIELSDFSAAASKQSAAQESIESAASSDGASSAGKMAQLESRLAELASSSGMDVGVAAVDLLTGDYAGYQGDQSMVSASMIKLTIAAAFLEQVKAGVYSLDDYYTLQPSDIVGGTGTIGGLGAGAQLTYREILERMIDVSDNTGANILIDEVGMNAINSEAQALGLTATQINRRMMDTEAIAAGIENYTSADDLAVLFKMIYDGTFVDAESSALVLGALEQQSDGGGIAGGLPYGVSFAHKTGSLATVRHDGGIVEGEHPFVLVTLCGGSGFYEQGALNIMASLGAAAYEEIV